MEPGVLQRRGRLSVEAGLPGAYTRLMGRAFATLSIGIVLLLCGHVPACAATDSDKDYDAALELFASDKGQEIITRYERYSWGARNSPDLLLLYCSSLWDLGKSVLPDAFVAAAPAHVVAFARGYLTLLSGRAGGASAIFYKLGERNDPLSRAWGNIGLLESALVTGNIAAMETPLGKVLEIRNRGLAGPVSRDIDFYDIYHKIHTARFADADKSLEETKNELHRVRYAELKLTLLLREDRFQEAEKMLQGLSEPERALDSIMVLHARLLQSMSGEQAQQAFLRDQFRKSPRNATIRLELAAARTFSSDAAQRAAGSAELQKIRDDYPNEVGVQLYVANRLLDDGGSKDPLKGIRNLPEVPVNFVMYHVVMAKALLPGGKTEAAMDNFNRARAMDAYDPEVLHLEYSIAMKRGDGKAAKRALLKALAVEPNAPDIMVALAELFQDEKNVVALLEVRDRVRALKRVVSPDLTKALDSMAQALCEPPAGREMPYACLHR
jgi:tetratricopeptide (TPR) repeat protein